MKYLVLCLFLGGCATTYHGRMDELAKQVDSLREHVIDMSAKTVTALTLLDDECQSREQSSRIRDGLIKQRLGILEAFNEMHKKRWPNLK